MEQVKQYFKDFPTRKECFVTSDGLIFHEKGDANMHAATLENNQVVAHLRTSSAPTTIEADAVKAPAVKKAPKAAKPEPKVKAAKQSSKPEEKGGGSGVGI
mgnify:CR=1 FL=1